MQLLLVEKLVDVAAYWARQSPIDAKRLERDEQQWSIQ